MQKNCTMKTDALDRKVITFKATHIGNTTKHIHGYWTDGTLDPTSTGCRITEAADVYARGHSERT
jgi:hypothetical protein